MKAHVVGKGAVTLSKSSFLGGGGEGNVYVIGDTAYKVYHDPSKMVPTGKIQELARVSDPDVIRPEDIILDGNNQPIGYTMRYVKDTHVMCALFPPDFRSQHGVTPEMTFKLVQSLQERVRNIHDAGVLLVDGNEMNFLVGDQFTKVYAIDTDSYQTRSYPATAIMPSIRDPQVQGHDFTELSDWFSFAVVSFNLFVGIHPFKGRHPSVLGFQDRMKAGISVFNPDVTMPKMVLPLDVIPESYRHWYKAVLEDGKRLSPPMGLSGAVIILSPTIRTITGTGNLDISELYDLSADILGFWDNGTANPLIWTADDMYRDQRRVYGSVKGVSGVGFSPRMGHAVVAGVSGGKLRLLDADTKAEVPLDLLADDVVSTNGRIYFRRHDKLMEVVLNDIGNKVVASPRMACTVMPRATKLFPGVAMQNVLGRTWPVILPKSGQTFQVPIKELDEYKIISARFENADNDRSRTGVLMVVGHKDGKYDRLVFRFDPAFNTYDIRIISDISPNTLNFVVLESGVCVCLTEDEKLEVFSVRKGSSGVKVVEDDVLGSDLILGVYQGGVVFRRRNKVYSMRMK